MRPVNEILDPSLYNLIHFIKTNENKTKQKTNKQTKIQKCNTKPKNYRKDQYILLDKERSTNSGLEVLTWVSGLAKMIFPLFPQKRLILRLEKFLHRTEVIVTKYFKVTPIDFPMPIISLAGTSEKYFHNSFESFELRIGGNVARFSSPVTLSRRAASSTESQSDQ